MIYAMMMTSSSIPLSSSIGHIEMAASVEDVVHLLVVSYDQRYSSQEREEATKQMEKVDSVHSSLSLVLSLSLALSRSSQLMCVPIPTPSL